MRNYHSCGRHGCPLPQTPFLPSSDGTGLQHPGIQRSTKHPTLHQVMTDSKMHRVLPHASAVGRKYRNVILHMHMLYVQYFSFVFKPPTTYTSDEDFIIPGVLEINAKHLLEIWVNHWSLCLTQTATKR